MHRFRFEWIVILLLLTGCSFVNGEWEDSVRKSFAVGDGGTLTLDSNLGSVDITAVDGNVLGVEIIRKMDVLDREEANEVLKDFILDFRPTGKDVLIRAEYRNRVQWWRFWDRNRLKIKFRITVPRKYNLDLKTSGGSIGVSDLEGEVTARTSGGSLQFGRIAGPLLARTSGGSIRLEGCAGRTDIHTSGGSIRVGETGAFLFARTSGGRIEIGEAGGAIDASTSGGSITAAMIRQPEADCRLNTSGGSIRVSLPEYVRLKIRARTSGGSVRTDFSTSFVGETRRTSLDGKINGGGPELSLHTSGGSIHILKGTRGSV